MAQQKLVTLTGVADLDAKFRTLPAKLQRKFVRSAMRKSAKRCQAEAKRIIRNEAYDTGSYYRVLKVRAMRRKRNRIGVSVLTDVEKLHALYASKHEGRLPNPAKGQSTPFFYPAAIEFGTEHVEAVAPMRRALYEPQEAYRALFAADVRALIAENAQKGAA